MKFKTGDKVRVMRGKDAGKEGQITKVLKDEQYESARRYHRQRSTYSRFKRDASGS